MNTRTFGDIGAAVLQILTEKQEIDMKLASAREVSQPIRTTPSRPEIPDALEELNTKGRRLAAATILRVKGWSKS